MQQERTETRRTGTIGKSCKKIQIQFYNIPEALRSDPTRVNQLMVSRQGNTFKVPKN